MEQDNKQTETLEAFLSTIQDADLKAKIQSTVDRERTKASQTAYNNARTSLATDQSFLAQLEPTFKEKFEKQAQMTEQEKYQAQLDEIKAQREALSIERNKMYVARELSTIGITDDEQLTNLYGLLVDKDEEATKSKVATYMSILTPMATSMAQQEINKKLATYTNPNSSHSNSELTKEQKFNQSLKDAQSRGDYQAVAQLLREKQTAK